MRRSGWRRGGRGCCWAARRAASSTSPRGDAIVLPAGVGHKLLHASADFLVVGAYPPGQDWDLLRGEPGERVRAAENIARVPLPEGDPVQGADGPLTELWR